MAFSFIRWCVCDGASHRIRLKKHAKKIILLDHTKDVIERELVVAAMGGEAIGCVQSARGAKEYKQWGWSITGRTYNQLEPAKGPDAGESDLSQH